MATFPDQDWFISYAAKLEADEDFRRHGRWFAGKVGFRVGRDTTTLRFDRGMILSVAPGYDEPDYLLSGSLEQWDYLFEKKWALVRLYRSRTILVRADPVRLMQNWKPLFFIVEGMKRAGKNA